MRIVDIIVTVLYGYLMNLEGITKIKKQSLQAQVYAKLKEQILSGTWKEGDKLPSEYQLCEMFGVSRVTIRAAVQQLSILGLVETRQGGGSFVRSITIADQFDTLHPVMSVNKNQDLITILEYRKIIEKGTVALARARVTPEDIDALELIYQKMLANVNDPQAFGEADIEFHYKLADISRNPIVIRIYSIIYEILTVAMTDIIEIQGTADGLRYHWMLIDALVNGTAANCENIMEEHLETTMKYVRKNAAAAGGASSIG
jgi:GntR family transcriptional repressor for pyruvate dehydrogenase complex